MRGPSAGGDVRGSVEDDGISLGGGDVTWLSLEDLLRDVQAGRVEGGAEAKEVLDAVGEVIACGCQMLHFLFFLQTGLFSMMTGSIRYSVSVEKNS